MSEHIQKIVLNNMKAKRIIIFGAALFAEKFYKKYKGVLQISHCVSNNKFEWGEKSFLGEIDVRKFVPAQIKQDDYLIVATATASFYQIELQLIEAGFKMFEDFTESNIADAIFKEKPIMLFYGNCILRDIYECILQVPELTSNYAPIFTQAYKGQTKYGNRVLFYAKDICSAYIYSQRILDRDEIHRLSADELPAGCKMLSVSNILFSGYFPQVDVRMDVYNDLYLYSYNAKREPIHWHTLYRRSDENINRLIEEGRTPDEIINILSRHDFYSAKAIRRNLRVAFKSIEIAENAIDIGVLDFIKANYQKIMLYQNFLHMHSCVIWEYVRRIFNKLNIDETGIGALEAKSPKYIHHGGDVPIYPCVVEALELEGIDENTVYEVMTYDGIEKMTFKEYIYHFAEYTRQVKEIKKMF